MKKNGARKPAIPQYIQMRCLRWNCSMLPHLLHCQAHSLPLIPRRTIIARRATNGTGIKTRNDSHTRLPMPHIQVRKKAPQFHPVISGGTGAENPCPDVFLVTRSLLFLVKSCCMLNLSFCDQVLYGQRGIIETKHVADRVPVSGSEELNSELSA